MGVDPQFGLACLGKVSTAYENDQDLMIQFYGFVAKEELACEEAELGPEIFGERMEMQQYLLEQMLKHMRNFNLDDQSAILEKNQEQMEKANFEAEASVLSVDQIQDIVRRRSLLYFSQDKSLFIIVTICLCGYSTSSILCSCHLAHSP